MPLNDDTAKQFCRLDSHWDTTQCRAQTPLGASHYSTCLQIGTQHSTAQHIIDCNKRQAYS